MKVREQVRWSICRKRERQSDRQFLQAVRQTPEPEKILEAAKEWKQRSWNHEISDAEVMAEMKKQFSYLFV
jgi:hypothetical protein